MEILRVENLCKTYGKGKNEVRALDHISFSVNKGEFIAIIVGADDFVCPQNIINKIKQLK